MTEMSVNTLLEMTANIVSSFVSNNTIRSVELPELISTIHASLSQANQPAPIDEPATELKPAVSIKKSVTDDYLICLNDGKKFKSLKRHLSQLGLTPEQYRTQWGLPRDYPMVAPGYAAKRSELAKASGLGSQRRKTVELAKARPEPVPSPAPAPKRRGRPAKAKA